ncbi:MAG: outer membrane protein assembly factor BamA [Flavobacteriales bacterium]
MLKPFFLGLILVLISTPKLYAQFDLGGQEQNINYAQPKTYTIGGISVAGDNGLDQSAVLLLIGVSVGDDIQVPGAETREIVKKFWKQNLFSDVQLYATKIEGNLIFLELYLDELPKLSKFAFRGISKSEVDKLKEKLNFHRGKVINNNLLGESKRKVVNHFVEKGFLDVDVEIKSVADSTMRKGRTLDLIIKKGKRIKIKSIEFAGVEKFKHAKLRRKMKETKVKKFYRIFKSSKYIEQKLEEDKANIMALYNANGYRDARIVNHTIKRSSKGLVEIDMEISEGNQYFFRDINWVGNTKYSSEELSKSLGIKSGDVYDEALLNERLEFSYAGTDIKSLYMNDGYLFFQLNPVEVLIEGDSIDFEMRMNEGSQAVIRNVSVIGNDKTKDNVIFREIRTVPGDLFRRSNVIRTQEVLTGLGYFNPQNMGITPKPDQATGMVDIEYAVEEQSTDQVQLQGAFGANRFTGTLGLTLNNFSIGNMFKKQAWNPVPSGDGQKLSLQISSNGTFYQSYSLSFVEPWLGGKKPNSLSVSLNHFVYDLTNNGKISSVGLSVGLGKRLKVPDDYFTLSQSIGLQRYKVQNYEIAEGFDDGTSHNLNYRLSLTRNSVFEQFFPTKGSTFSLTGEFTPPFSMLNNKDYSRIDAQERYKWLEYYKVKFAASWHTPVVGKMILKTHFETAALSSYDDEVGIPPFERYHIGGDGLNTGSRFNGSEFVALRGYNNRSLNPYANTNTAASAYLKYYFEARYPLVRSPQSTIYGLAFAEAGNGFDGFKSMNLYDTKRSAGVGFRVIMPMLGILGVDFAHGFDPLYGESEKSGWQTHFILGQQF